MVIASLNLFNNVDLKYIMFFSQKTHIYSIIYLKQSSITVKYKTWKQKNLQNNTTLRQHCVLGYGENRNVVLMWNVDRTVFKNPKLYILSFKYL